MDGFFYILQHYLGRRRNCYTLAIRNVDRALVYATKARKLKKEDLHEVIERLILIPIIEIHFIL